MQNVFYLFSFVLFYYQLDNILKPLLYDKYELFQQDPIIFYPIIQSANYFIFYVFTLFTFHLIFISKIKNYTIYALSFIYIKYVMDTILTNNAISIYQYEFRRTLMWLFTTPLILKMYCDMNHLTLTQISAQYHIGSNVVHILLFPFRKTDYNSWIIIGLSIFEAIFIYKLFNFQHQKYTMLIIYIWCLFSFIAFIDVLNVFSIHDIQICYLLSDMIAKMSIILITNDNDEQLYFIKSNIDLQSISLLGLIKKNIKQFENNTNITPKCKMIIQELNNKITQYVPVDKTTLKLELLKKILPLELEDKYLTQSKEYKPYNSVCVLFTDIVSYTELAKQYDAQVMYQLLNEIYTRFDDIVTKYVNIQKIETIGDAYMVVGNIYTDTTISDTNNSDKKKNIKSMILLAIDFLKEIKNVPSPNIDKPLELRIGIHIGKVVVGMLGVEIPRLCVVGNTVNVANRLQTTAEPSTIQVSRHVYEFIEEIDFGREIKFVLNENVYLKNIGTMNTYTYTPHSR